LVKERFTNQKLPAIISKVMGKYLVAIEKCSDYEQVSEAFARLKEKANLKEFEKKVSGKKVLVKPNILGPYSPDKAVTTHPALVKEVVKWMQTAGAEVIVGDNGGLTGYARNERSAKRSGIISASLGSFQNIAQKAKEVELDSKYFSKLTVSQAVLEADYIINLPKLKTHTLTLLTLGIKNMFGMLVGGSKSLVHNSAPQLESFGEALVDIYQIRPPDLTIMDGVIGMDGNGPAHGRVRPISYLLASENCPSLDLMVCEMVGVEPSRVHHLRISQERGLGAKNLAEIEIIGEYQKIPRFKLPSTLARRSFLGFIVNRYVYRRVIESKLVLDREKCTGCKVCVEACPSGAMEWKEDHPEINQEKCIRCLCCSELCTEGAWRTTGMMRFLRSNF